MREITVYCMCTIKLYVNTLPHTHGLLIKPVKKNKSTENRSIWNKSLIHRGPRTKLLLYRLQARMCAIIYYSRANVHMREVEVRLMLLVGAGQRPTE